MAKQDLKMSSMFALFSLAIAITPLLQLCFILCIYPRVYVIVWERSQLCQDEEWNSLFIYLFIFLLIVIILFIGFRFLWVWEKWIKGLTRKLVWVKIPVQILLGENLFMSNLNRRNYPSPEFVVNIFCLKDCFCYFYIFLFDFWRQTYIFWSIYRL